ncbi:hypothetical protein C8A01DRAFT_42050 [Parachaetomium inaequale]|uniref:Uncharacterized protein n=1 Tax=Parachaetomium inaequale TaxID=2588326 RepID=A0AAN6P8N5_9PEZI|nr:hypothetical protein C8A01DRAFT_42050 [Parachaetomium inaequale]
MASDGNIPGAGDNLRDIKGDIIAKLDETAHPSLRNFFEGLRVEVVGGAATLNLIESIQKDIAGREFLKIVDNEALTRVYAERDTWEKAAGKIKSGGGGGDIAVDCDGLMLYPTPFTGDEKDTAKRKKIIYASALLEGSAAAGVFKGVQKVTTNPDNSDTWPWKTVAAFIDHLAHSFFKDLLYRKGKADDYKA